MMATCVPGGGDECLKELERAVKQDDARAVIVNSSHQGHVPDEDAARPFFKLVTDLDIPVFVHPGDCTTPAMEDYRLASSIGRPADNCLSLARLIVRGLRAVSDASSLSAVISAAASARSSAAWTTRTLSRTSAFSWLL